MNFQPSQEIRFAVVMYGGVSLAIYMNGIAQELLRAVRATSDLPDADLSGTELIYRELGQRLGSRIVVDILSGTSAGGLNAAFLAKALANSNKNLDALQKMWFEEADISKLLNDYGSEPRRFPTGPIKTSLLNSRRMFSKLLDAFRAMDHRSQRDKTPLADQIDLFLTATDLHGLAAPIHLADSAIEEKVHKAAFHFAFDPALGSNHFHFDYNPMLAFAGRCTSSFPVAFEPMRLTDANLTPELRNKYEPFFANYLALGVDDWDTRPFADGGYLDNKPFTYAIDAIPHRETTVPCQRKLLFIDPSPEQPRNSHAGPVSFLTNAFLAFHTLPAAETIRGDVDAVNARAGLQRRLRALLDRAVNNRSTSAFPGNRNDYPELDLAETVQRFGEAYAPYHHLRVFAVTNWIARLAGIEEETVRQWRERHFSPCRTVGKQTENRFLFLYDMDFRVRRLRFLRDRVDHQRAALNQQLRRLRVAKARLESPLESPLRGIQGIDEFGAALAGQMSDLLRSTSATVHRLLQDDSHLWDFYHRFEDHDMVTFPVMESAGVKDLTEVQVYRVSPSRKENLAGSAFFHFGAFFSRSWREHDIREGRLNGAARIIHACLAAPGDASLRAELTRRAHNIILSENPLPKTAGPRIWQVIAWSLRAAAILVRMFHGLRSRRR